MKKEARNKYLIKNTAIFAIGNFATKFISFFLIPLYTNVLTTTEYGIVDLLYALCSVLMPLLTLNICEAVLRFAMDKDADTAKIMSIGNLLIIISAVLGLISIPILNSIEAYSEYSSYFYLYLVTLGMSQIFLCNLKGQEKLIDYSVGNFIHTLAIAIFNILFLVVFEMGIKGYFLAYTISNIVTALYAFIRGKVILSIKNFKFDKKLFIEMTKYSVLLIPNSFMWWIMNSSDRVMVANFLGESANGIYAISYKLPTLLTTITTVFTHAWIYSAVNENESEDKEEYTNYVFKKLVAIIFLLSSGMMMIIKPFLSIYVTKEYFGAWQYTPFLFIGFTFLTLASFLSSSYNVNKDSKGFLFSGMGGAVVNIVFNFILIPIIGISGAAIATCLSYIAVFVYRIIDTKKYVKINIFYKEFFLAVLLIITQAACLFINNMFGQCLLIIEFLLILLLFKNTWLPMLKTILNKIKSR